ncbi:hypothetical protein PIB30_019088 [Stylosanthes scabra]|uniref:Uncharacterized protein n=1 Tax=Stylosanthes scabra TaxID=79078 RepID=A0ABU6U742_9FABA|nr:hypothetical protein [Stylosanthes scabra]
MPIYHDYHGDSRSSSISTWDQIQPSLKSLLPSYEPILCDSTVVASLLSNSICTDFEHIATLHEIQDENYSDPESKSKGKEGDRTWWWRTGWIEGDRQSESVIIGDCMRLARKEGREEELWVPLAELPRPWLSESGQNDRVAIGAEDAAVTKGKPEITDLDLARAESVQRPPPKPPHLNPYTAALGDSSTAKILVVGRIGAMDDGGEQDTSSNLVSAEEMQPWVTTVVEGELTTGAEVGASVKEKRRTIVAGVNTTMIDGGIWTRQLRRFLSLNPPPLLAAIFPWDRGGGGSHGIYSATEVSFSSSRKRQASMGTAPTTPCDAIPTTTESPWGRDGQVAAFNGGATQKLVGERGGSPGFPSAVADGEG